MPGSPAGQGPASQVPAAIRTMRVLSFLARQPEPVPLDRIAHAVGMPRSSAYHLLRAMVDQGFCVHLESERRFGLGVAAFEVGYGYTRQAPLERLARPRMSRLVDQVGQSAHLVVLHGREVLYVVEERAPGRPPLVTDVGVRLPAQLTASGRAILAALPTRQVRALFPDASVFVDRHGGGPTSPTALRALLTDTRQRGYAEEDGEVTPGLASVAAAVLDHNRHPVASVAVTFEQDRSTDLDRQRYASAVTRTAADLTHRLAGGARPG